MTVPASQSTPALSLQAPTAGAEPDHRPAVGRAKLGDRIFQEICRTAAWLVVVLAALLVVVLVCKSWLAIRTIGSHFLTQTTWDPEPTHRVFGALAFVYGTVVSSALAMLIAAPLGIGAAAFLSEIAPVWLRRPASFLVEMLAAIPSVVYGFWGLFFLAPNVQQLISWLGGPTHGGVGLLSAGLILAIMIVPYIAAIAYDACRAVPQSQREGALALGATRWQAIWTVVLPNARPGIIGGCFLALGRALGETMAVTMLIGNRPEIHLSLIAPADSIASAIANQFTEATYDLYLSALVELGLLLFIVTVAVNSLARLLITRVGKGWPASWWSIWKPAGTVWPYFADGRRQTGQDGHPAPLAPRNSQRINRLMTGVLSLCLATTLGPLFLILGYLVYRGVGALSWEFFVRLPAPVGETGGGMANALYGSGLLVGLATLCAMPLGLLAAIHLAEHRNDRLASAVRFISELLGGVPSIVIGIFAYTALVVPMGRFSGWAGSFALGVIMLPTILRASEEALKLVPQSLRDASYALGASRWQTVIRVSVPAALPAIITGVFLAVARAAGETAPLLLTAASNQFWPTSPGDFTPSLPVYIFTYAMSPYPDWQRQAWAAALVLLGVVLFLNFGIRLLTGKGMLSASRAG
jgi:phosphate transport system permease protein